MIGIPKVKWEAGQEEDGCLVIRASVYGVSVIRRYPHSTITDLYTLRWYISGIQQQVGLLMVKGHYLGYDRPGPRY